MSEFDTATDLSMATEIQDLEKLHAQAQGIAEDLRQDEFDSPDERLAKQCELIARVKEATTLGRSEEVQNMVGWIGNNALHGLLEIRLRTTFHEQTEELGYAEAAARETIDQAAELMGRYGARTKAAIEFERQLDSIFERTIPRGFIAPYEELINRQKVSIIADRHYLIDEDGNLTRIMDDLTETNSQEEDARRRALIAVADSHEGLNMKQLFGAVYGAEENYDRSKIEPIAEWLLSIPMKDQKLIVSYKGSKDPNAKRKETRICVSPDFDLRVEKADLSTEKEISVNREKAKRQLVDLCFVFNWLHGRNDVLVDYGHDPIPYDLLEDLVPYIPATKFVSDAALERYTKLAFQQTLEAAENPDSHLELIYNINELSLMSRQKIEAQERKQARAEAAARVASEGKTLEQIEEDTRMRALAEAEAEAKAKKDAEIAVAAAKAAGTLLKLLEKTKARDLVGMLAEMKVTGQRVIESGLVRMKDRKLVAGDKDTEFWPTLIDSLVYKK